MVTTVHFPGPLWSSRGLVWCHNGDGIDPCKQLGNLQIQSVNITNALVQHQEG
jgi:hypothetical protein